MGWKKDKALWLPDTFMNEAPEEYWGEEQDPDTGLLHSTESLDTFWPGNTYYGHNGWPNATVTTKGIHQHIPYNFSARALLNKPGGEQTNHTGLYQIEIAWQAKHIRNLPQLTKDNLRRLMRMLMERTQIPPVSTVVWVPYPESYGFNAKQRLHGKAWATYVGWLGHQHADENDHGDPGDIDIEWLLDEPTPVPKEWLDMDTEEFRREMERFFALEGFGDIALQKRTGQVKAWQLPGNKTIYSAIEHEGKLAIQAHTDPAVVQFWQGIGVFPNPIPVLSEEMAKKQANIDVVVGS